MTLTAKNNTLNYEGIDAVITFDADTLRFMGEIKDQFGVKRFYARSVSCLKEEYELTVAQVREIADIHESLVAQLSNIQETIQSGEAKIQIRLTDSEWHVGTTIKMMLGLADGASFEVQQTPI